MLSAATSSWTPVSALHTPHLETVHQIVPYLAKFEIYAVGCQLRGWPNFHSHLACQEVNDPPPRTDPPGWKTARWTCCNRSPVAVKYLPTMPTLKTQISKFDGTVTELENNLGLHDDIQAYLKLERNGNWYAYCSGVAKVAIFKYATYNHTSRRLKFDELVRIHGYYGHSKSTSTSIANEVEAERGLGNANLIHTTAKQPSNALTSTCCGVQGMDRADIHTVEI